MNTSVVEQFGARTDDDALVERALLPLAEIGKRLFTALGRFQHSHGLSFAQLRAIGALGHERRTVGEVASALGLSMPAASEIVDRLVEAGYAERGVNPDNRRQTLVWSTPAADAMKRELHDLRRAQLRDAMARLAPEERPVFLRSLEALAESLRRDPAELDERWTGGCPLGAGAAMTTAATTGATATETGGNGE